MLNKVDKNDHQDSASIFLFSNILDVFVIDKLLSIRTYYQYLTCDIC